MGGAGQVDRGRDRDPDPDGVDSGSSGTGSAASGDDAIAEFCAEAGFDLCAKGMDKVVARLKKRCLGTLIDFNAAGTLVSKAGAVLKISKDQLLPLPPNWAQCCDDVFEDVADFACATFITERLPGWDPARSSLNTYFIAHCLVIFWNTLRSMSRQRARMDYDLDDVDAIIAEQVDLSPGPEDRVTRRSGFRFAVDAMIADGVDMPYVIKRIVGRARRDEIADELGVSVSHLYRELQKFAAILNDNGFSIRTGGQ